MIQSPGVSLGVSSHSSPVLAALIFFKRESLYQDACYRAVKRSRLLRTHCNNWPLSWMFTPNFGEVEGCSPRQVF